MKTRWAISLFLAVGMFLVPAGPANGAIANLVNGDFETSPANSNGSFPVPWYSGHPGNWREFRYAGLGGYTGTAAAFGWQSGQDGYIYQQVGTLASETGITLDGTVYNRTNGNRVGDFDVSFWYTPPAVFTPAEGTDIAGAGTQIGSTATFTEGGNLTVVTTGSTPTSEAFSHTVNFAGSGISPGDEVWVRLGDAANPVGNDEPFLDDLSVSATTGPPPPPPTTMGPTVGTLSATGNLETWPSPAHLAANVGATGIGVGPWGRNGTQLSIAVDGSGQVVGLFDNQQIWTWPSVNDFANNTNATQIGSGPWNRNASQLSIAADGSGTVVGLFDNQQIWTWSSIADFAANTNPTQIGSSGPWGRNAANLTIGADDEGNVYGFFDNGQLWTWSSIADFAGNTNPVQIGTRPDWTGISTAMFAYGSPSDPIPEPATLAMLSLAACGLGGYVRRRHKV